MEKTQEEKTTQFLKPPAVYFPNETEKDELFNDGTYIYVKDEDWWLNDPMNDRTLFILDSKTLARKTQCSFYIDADYHIESCCKHKSDMIVLFSNFYESDFFPMDSIKHLIVVCDSAMNIKYQWEFTYTAHLDNIEASNYYITLSKKSCPLILYSLDGQRL
jgi:hypothetical protein